jgi:integrase
MAKNPVFKKCGCRIAVTDDNGEAVIGPDGKPKMRRLGADCPQLRRGNGWNPKHGTWYFQMEVNVGKNRPRQHLSQGGIATSEDAETVVSDIRRLLALADDHADDPATAEKNRLAIVERIRTTLKDRKALPNYDEIRKNLRTGQPIVDKMTTGEWLTQWLASKGDLAPGTARSYGIHIDVHLNPHLGDVLLDGLRTAHVHAMFAAIAERADILPAENAARRAVENAMKQARSLGDRAAANAARAKLADMPPYRRPTGPATRQRILATLRSALSAACSEQLLTLNVAKLATLPSGKRPKAKVWTPNRVAEWRRTGDKPSAVMVWTAEQTAAFLNRAVGHEHGVLFHLIAFTGLRRGEACGLRWVDLDLTASEMTVTQQIVQLGWETALTSPKSDAGERVVALDAATASRLKSHRARQGKQRLAHGPGWIDTGLVFTAPDGSPLHPGWISRQFELLVREADLPPIRLHDMRHGAATHALSAGVDIKIVQEMLGHSNSAITRDTYTSVVSESQHAAAEAIASIINAGHALHLTGTAR